jgi:hypothetical protein
MLPLATALAAVSGCMLSTIGSADAAPATSMPVAAAPDRAGEWWLTALGVPQAWKASGIRPPGAGVTVAVLSTGVDGTHPDLASDVITGPDYSKSGARPSDQFWGTEGTAVASLIAGHGHGPADRDGLAGTKGITGVAPGARILSLRVTLEYNDSRNGDAAITRHLSDSIAAGIRYAVAHGASVIALPLDPGTLGPVLTGDPAAGGGSQQERAAVSAALARGVVLIAPAGDNGASTGSTTYPAAYPGVLAVGATDTAGNLESYSNRNAYVSLTAPGSGLMVATPRGGYITIKTTDMSAALTAGVAALIRAKYPRLSPLQVNQAITHGSGSLSAIGALRAAAAVAAKLPQATPSTAQGVASAAATGATPVRPRATASNSATASGSLDSAAGSAVRDAAIAAGALIAVLVIALPVTRYRQRRVRAARARHVPRPHEPTHAGRTATGGFQAITGGFPALSSHGAHAAPRGTGSQPALHGPGQPVSGQVVSRQAMSRPGMAGRDGAGQAGSTQAVHTARVPGHAARGALMPRLGRARMLPPARDDAGSPPWQPAQAPQDAADLPGAGLAPAAPAQGPLGRLTLPPWARVPAELTAAPIPAEFPDWKGAGTGPMYVWNPATNSGPFPALRPEDEPR